MKIECTKYLPCPFYNKITSFFADLKIEEDKVILICNLVTSACQTCCCQCSPEPIYSCDKNSRVNDFFSIVGLMKIKKDYERHLL